MVRLDRVITTNCVCIDYSLVKGHGEAHIGVLLHARG
jgi:hypothetical protein